MTNGRHEQEPTRRSDEYWGPGWAHLRVYSPWRDDSPIMPSLVLPTRKAARAELQATLAQDPELRVPAAHLRGLIERDVHDKEGLLLYYLNDEGLMWAWAYFPVASRATSITTAQEFFHAWRTEMLSDESYRAIIDHPGVTVIGLARWF